ncbi:hypothetical protein FRC19_008194 [Serendipita sp. 401]|nr:hypothetical protein FRC19_008194 [Serendipita sp. 401]
MNAQSTSTDAHRRQSSNEKEDSSQGMLYQRHLEDSFTVNETQGASVERSFTNSHLHRHFGGSQGSFGRAVIYIQPQKSSNFFRRMFGGLRQRGPDGSRSERKEANKDY